MPATAILISVSCFIYTNLCFILCDFRFYHGLCGLDEAELLNLLNPLNFLTPPWTPLNPLELLEPFAVCKTKTAKTPCVGCKMSLTSHWCCACLKILKQAWIFSVNYIITLQGLCIHRKAINKNKPSYPLDGILLQERLPHARQNSLILFIALERMVAFILMKVLICFWFGC